MEQGKQMLNPDEVAGDPAPVENDTLTGLLTCCIKRIDHQALNDHACYAMMLSDENGAAFHHVDHRFVKDLPSCGLPNPEPTVATKPGTLALEFLWMR